MTNNGKRVAWVTGGGTGSANPGRSIWRRTAGPWWCRAAARRNWTGWWPTSAKRAATPRRSRSMSARRPTSTRRPSRSGKTRPDRSAGQQCRRQRAQAKLGRHGTGRLGKVVEINLNGVLYCMRAVLPAMRKQKDGCIINVASWAGRHVSKMPGPAYTATKHAVLALTHSFNMDECANGLRACCFSPGEVATPILKSRPVPPNEAEMAKMLQPEDCGRTIAFVASMPPRVCVNEILISPTHNRGLFRRRRAMIDCAGWARLARRLEERGGKACPTHPASQY